MISSPKKKVPKSYLEFKRYMFQKWCRENYPTFDADSNVQAEIIDVLTSEMHEHKPFPVSFLYRSTLHVKECSKAGIIEIERRKEELSEQQLKNIYQCIARLTEDELVEIAEASPTLAYWVFETIFVQEDYRPQRFSEFQLVRLGRLDKKRTQKIRQLALSNVQNKQIKASV